MTISEYFNPIKSYELFGYNEKFIFFKDLFTKNQFPKVLLLTGDRGIGKFTLVNHLLHYYFDKEYESKKNKINPNSSFHLEFTNGLFPNIFYLKGISSKSLKLDDVRKLKDDLSKSSIYNKKRFIILDDVETYNANILNALLKIIEEPSNNNNFILINNKSSSLLETIKSRSIEIKILQNDILTNQILSSLLNLYSPKLLLQKDLVKTSPGNFLKFNHFFQEKKIDLDEKFIINLNKILNIYKKEKDILFKDLILFYYEYYLKKINFDKINKINNFIENRSFIAKNINNFFLYNLNQNTLINTIESKFNE